MSEIVKQNSHILDVELENLGESEASQDFEQDKQHDSGRNLIKAKPASERQRSDKISQFQHFSEISLEGENKNKGSIVEEDLIKHKVSDTNSNQQLEDDFLVESDPKQSLEELDKVKVDFDLSSQQITPFDRYQYVQTLNNPLSGTEDCKNDEIITVQICKPNLKFKQKGNIPVPTEKDFYTVCDKSEKNKECFLKLNNELESKKSVTCFYCEKQIPAQKQYYTCQHNDFFVCINCNLQHYLRKKIVSRTSEHFSYERYVMQAVRDDDDELNSNAELNDQKEDKRRKDLIKLADMTSNPNDGNVKSNSYAELVEEEDKEMSLRKHAIVGFWKKFNGSYVCYRMIRIERPLLLKPVNEGCSIELLLHVGQDNEIYYFNKEGSDESPGIRLNILNTVAVVKGENLSPLTTNIDQPPISIYFDISNPKVLYILKSAFGMLQNKSLGEKDNFLKIQAPPCTALPQLINRNNKKYLVLVSQIAMTSIKNNSRFLSSPVKDTKLSQEGSEWFSSTYRNLYFISLSTQDTTIQSVDFVIYDANLLLKVEQDKDTKNEVVWFVRNKSVILMEWGSPVSPEDYSIELEQSSLLKSTSRESEIIQSKNLPPYQSIIKQFMFSPSEGSLRYEQQSDDLLARLKKLIEKKFLMIGKIHFNNKRVSIIFVNGGVFSFQLTDPTPFASDGQWFGEIGNNKGFKLERLKIQQDSSIAGVWDLDNSKQYKQVIGYVNSQNCKWVGYMQNENGLDKQFISFKNLTLDKKTGTIFGKGIHDYCQDFISYQVTGHINFENLQLNFQEIITDEKSGHSSTLYFTGSLNKSRTRIKGIWGKTKDQKNENQFYLEMFSDENLEVTLELKDDKNLTQYKLQGRFNLQESTIIGKATQYEQEDEEFQFNAITQRSRACTWLKNLSLNDGQFSQAIGPDKKQRLLVCGNIRESVKEEFKNVNGYKLYHLDVVDLDEDFGKTIFKTLQRSLTKNKDKLANKESESPPTENVQEHLNTVHILEFMLPSFFRYVKDDSGNLKLPAHILMPLNIEVEQNEQSLQIKCSQFNGQLFFKDPLTKRVQLIYMQGHSAKLQKQLNLPQWPSSQSDDVQVQYPIMAYKTQLPTNNEIVIVNLVKNEPQKIINLEPFKFIQFIEVGLNPERYLYPNYSDKNVNTCIFFLVEYEGTFRVMYYKVFPYPLNILNQSKFTCFQTKEIIQILSGRLQISTLKTISISPERFTNEKIISASTLQRPQLEGVQIMVILQLIDGIFYFSLNDESYLEQFSNSSQLNMIKLMMQRGPYEEIYYGERNEQIGDQIVCIQFKTKEKLQLTTVMKLNGARLLALSILPITHYDSENFRQHQLICFDSNYQYKVLDFKDSDCEPTIELQKDIHQHPKIEMVMEHLELNPWSRLTGSSRGFTVLLDQVVSSKLTKTVAATLSINSYLVDFQEVFDFYHDTKFKKKKENCKFKQAEPSHINSIRGIPWMQKSLFEVTDQTMNYFIVTGSKFSKRVELMMPDQLKRLQGVQDMLLIGNEFIAIGIQSAGQYLLFNQSDFQYFSTIDYSDLKQIGSCVNGNQYFFGTKVLRQRRTEIFIKFSKEKYSKFDLLFDVQSIQKHFTEQLIRKIETVKNKISYQDIYKSLHHSSGKLFYLITLRNIKQSQIRQVLNKSEALITNLYENVLKDDQKSLTGKTIKINVYQIDADHNNENKHAVCYTIFSDELDQEFQKSMDKSNTQFVITKNYFVGSIGLKVFFITLDKFEEVEKLSQLDDKLDNIQHTSLDFTVINIAEFFNSQSTRNGMIIQLVTQTNLDIAEKGEVRENVIQISFSNLAILWDLKENKEVTFIENPAKFSNFDSFVRTGIVPHLHTFNKEMKNASFLTSNEKQTLFVQPAQSTTSSSHLFRNFCELDLHDVQFIKRCENDDIHVKKIDFETILAEFNGLTFFEIFKSNADYMELIMTQITNAELKQKLSIDSSGNQSDNIIIRRLFWTLLLPIISQGPDPIFDKKQLNQKKDSPKLKNLKNILQEKLFDQEGQYMLDPLLSLLMVSEEFRLSNLVANFDGFKKVFNMKSKTINKFMEQSSFWNEQTIDVKSLKWNVHDKIITFGQNTSQLSPAKIIEQVKTVQLNRTPLWKKFKAISIKFFNYIRTGFKNDERSLVDDEILANNQMIPVKVMILEIEWLSESMRDLYIYMSKWEDSNLFGNEFIKILLEQQYYSTQIILKVFVPYMLYMFASLAYMSYFVPTKVCTSFLGDVEQKTLQGAWLRIIIIIFGILFLFIEMMQMYMLKVGYFEDFWNYLYISSIILTLYVVVEHSTQFSGVDYDSFMAITSVAIVMQWGMMYYWMRLFPNLAFFVTFLVEVTKDIAPFVAMFFICIFMFGNAIYVIQISHQDVRHLSASGEEQVDEDEPLFQNVFNVQFIDALFSQYNVALGQASTDGFGNEQPLVWIYYIIATLWTQITFFNMLIGIMGQSFERVTEAKERNSLMERTKMYADFLWVINLSKELKDMRYLYIIQPETEEGDDELEGSISSVKRSINKLEKNLQSQISAQSSKICTEVADFQISSLNHLNDKVSRIQQSFDTEIKGINEKFDQLMELMKQSKK